MNICPACQEPVWPDMLHHCKAPLRITNSTVPTMGTLQRIQGDINDIKAAICPTVEFAMEESRQEVRLAYTNRLKAIMESQDMLMQSQGALSKRQDEDREAISSWISNAEQNLVGYLDAARNEQARLWALVNGVIHAQIGLAEQVKILTDTIENNRSAQALFNEFVIGMLAKQGKVKVIRNGNGDRRTTKTRRS